MRRTEIQIGHIYRTSRYHYRGRFFDENRFGRRKEGQGQSVSLILRISMNIHESNLATFSFMFIQAKNILRFMHSQLFLAFIILLEISFLQMHLKILLISRVI